MIFTSSFLTTAGIQLLTQAASGSSIVWTDCGCSSVYDQDTITAATTTFDSFVCKGTAVATFNETGNVAAISCSMTNNDQNCTEGDADVFGLWAHVVDPLGDIGEDVLVLIAKRGSAAATHFPEYIDETTELTAIVDLSVEMNDGVVASINLIQSAFALARDLQTEISAREALSARVAANEDVCSRAVTTHASGTPTVGEAQTIYGKKTFKGDIYIGDVTGVTLKFHGEEQGHYGYADIEAENNDDGSRARLVFNVDGINQIECEGNLMPFENSEYALGSQNYRWTSIYADYLRLQTTPRDSVQTDTLAVIGNALNNNSGALKIRSNVQYVRENGVLVRPSESTISLSNTKYASDGSTVLADTTIKLECDYDNNSIITLSSYHDDVQVRIEGGLTVIGEIDTATVTAILPNEYNGGGSGSLSVGALALVYITSTQTIYDAFTGTVIGQHNVVDMKMYYAIGAYGYFSQGDQISITSSMRFRLLNQLDGAGGMALVMRIA